MISFLKLAIKSVQQLPNDPPPLPYSWPAAAGERAGISRGGSMCLTTTTNKYKMSHQRARGDCCKIMCNCAARRELRTHGRRVGDKNALKRARHRGSSNAGRHICTMWHLTEGSVGNYVTRTFEIWASALIMNAFSFFLVVQSEAVQVRKI